MRLINLHTFFAAGIISLAPLFMLPSAFGQIQPKTSFSRSNIGECCGNDATISLAELTGGSGGTGKRASISFHNGNEAEGTLQLIQDAMPRRLKIFDNQAYGMGLQMSGSLYSDGVGTSYLAGSLSIGANGNADAALHIKAANNVWDRLTQIQPSAANKPALNLMASTDGSLNYNWWSWGVLPTGSWAIQPSTAFGGNSGLFVDRSGNVGIGTTLASTSLSVSSASEDLLHLSKKTGAAGDNIYLVFSHGDNTSSANARAKIGVNIKSGGAGRLVFQTGYSTTLVEQMRIDEAGNVGIGITNPQQKLHVKGTVYSTEVKVDLAAGNGPDYVFEPTYRLKPLAEIETYIKENKHLPEVPTAKAMEKNGVLLGEMNMLLLKKVEELTIYSIEQNKKLNEQQLLIQELIKEMQQLKTEAKKTKN
jgi:hypothetical protein